MNRIFRPLAAALIATCLLATACACSAQNFKTFKHRLEAENFRLTVTVDGVSSVTEIDGNVYYHPDGLGGESGVEIYYRETHEETIRSYYKNGDSWTVEDSPKPEYIVQIRDRIANPDNYEKVDDEYRMIDGLIEGMSNCTLKLGRDDAIFSFTYEGKSVRFTYSDFGRIDLTLPSVE